MDSTQEDRFGMLIKMELFLSNNAATLAINPDIAIIQGGIVQNNTDIIQADSTATRNLTGITLDKNQYRTNVENSLLTVAGAARGYYTTNSDLSKKRMVTFVKTDITRLRDSDVIIKADQVHDVADPIKTSLAAWGVADTDVDALPTHVATYRQWLQKPASERNISTVAGINVDKEFEDSDELLGNLDDHMSVYEYTNNLLFQNYRLSRAIDDSGGNSGSEGFEVNNTTIPGNGSLILNGVNLDDLTKQIYIRVIGGSGLFICSTDGSTGPCTSGFLAEPGVTYKITVGDLGLNPALPQIQITNPGTEAVVFRFGTKVNP